MSVTREEMLARRRQQQQLSELIDAITTPTIENMRNAFEESPGISPQHTRRNTIIPPPVPPVPERPTASFATPEDDIPDFTVESDEPEDDGDEREGDSDNPSGLSDRDLEVRFLEAYGVGIRNNKVYYVHGISNGRLLCYTLHPNGRMGSTTVRMRYKVDIEFPIPKLGYINHDGRILLIRRRHKNTGNIRYRKGLMPKTLSITEVSNREMEQVERSCLYFGSSSSFYPNFNKIAYSLFFHKLFDYGTAFKAVHNLETLSAAFTNSFGIMVNFNTDKMCLIKNEYYIGWWSVKLKCWVINTNIFNEELDLLGIPYIYREV